MSPNTAAVAAGARVLVVADQPLPLTLTEGTELTIINVNEAAAAEETAARGRVDVAVVALDLSASDGLALGAALAAAHPDLPVLVLVEPGTVPLSQVQAQGLAGLVAAPPTREGFLHEVRTALHHAYGEAPERAAPRPLLGEARAMKRLRKLIDRAALGIATILIRGETGTGKELVARAVHLASERRDGPMVTVHCGALPDALLESELFGYERGAFTGATQSKAGRVELAEGGTLFLDEIGDVTPSIQVKLLRLLQERAYQRLGDNGTRHADVRFVVATHRDLDAMVAAGSFREDLFYRLNVVPLWVPPLRARRDDVPVLARHFCHRFAEENQRAVSLSEDALVFLRGQRFPGNVRQLQNLMERLVVLSPPGVIDAAAIKSQLVEADAFKTDGDHRSISTSSTPDEDAVVPLDEAVRAAERKAILVALHAARGNRSQAARLLGISRATFYNKLKEHDLP